MVLVMALTVLLSVISYAVDRSSFETLLSLYVFSFALYFVLSKRVIDFKWLFFLGMLPRVLLLFSEPNLSDDYFRFLWDGFLTGNGYGAYAHLPTDIAPHLMARYSDQSGFLNELLSGMNSPGYYSVYPPVNQWVFWLASAFSSIKVGLIVLKVLLLGAEIGVFFILNKLLQRFRLSLKNLSLYWFNPLVILEIMGNAHFEGVMLFFVLSAVYGLSRLKTVEGGFYFALSFLSKLFVGMFFPLLYLKTFGKKRLLLVSVFVIVVVLSFLPFLSMVELKQMFTSVDLYFRRFEFNGSLYYLCRAVGRQITGYNEIAIIGPSLAGLSLLLILLISWIYRFKNRLSMFTGFILINTVYLLCSPIVHPWYLILMIGFSVLSPYRSVLVWSLVVVFSYYAYSNSDYSESLVLVATEYLVFMIFLLRDIKAHFSWNKLVSALKLA